MREIFGPLEKIQFEIFGLQLSDPNGFVSNLVITTVCFFLANKLRKKQNNDLVYQGYIRFYLFLGLSTLFAGFGHLFENYFTYNFLLIISWFLSGVSGYFIEIATVQKLMPDKLKWISRFTVNLQMVIFTVALIMTSNFNVAIINHFFSLIMVVSFIHLYHYIKYKVNYGIYIAYGFFFSLLSIIFRFGKISISDWFNYNDIGHLFIAGGIMIMFKGVYNIEESTIEESTYVRLNQDEIN